MGLDELYSKVHDELECYEVTLGAQHVPAKAEPRVTGLRRLSAKYGTSDRSNH